MGLQQGSLVMAKAAVVILFLLSQAQLSLAIWPSRSKLRIPNDALLSSRRSTGPAQFIQASSIHQSDTYEIALQELRQLESEPLCHRVAARLLVNNCELLEGKDEATVLTDSGRQIRDFVDSYAASLAICDLERGSFVIPKECAKFREPVLGQMPIGNEVYLHVTSTEIDACLSGLGVSDSAWNTWVSYRHKALRFCDAARADNDKAQHIRLFQKLTKIMNQMTNSVDQELETRLRDFDRRSQEATNKIDNLSPTVDRIGQGLRDIESIISEVMPNTLMRSTEAMNGGIESAVNLQRLLEVMMRDVLNGHAEAASAHEQSLQVMSQRTESEMGAVMGMVAVAVASTTTLQNQIELSRLQATELEHKQNSLEHGLERLINITDGLSSKYDDHTQLLYRAHNMTNEILESLEDTAASASIIGKSFSARDLATSWWPYIWCPTLSLVMGSYGLPPSATRNIGLLALGEVAGFLISQFRSLSFLFLSHPTPTYFTFLSSYANTLNSSVPVE